MRHLMLGINDCKSMLVRAEWLDDPECLLLGAQIGITDVPDAKRRVSFAPNPSHLLARRTIPKAAV